MTRDLIGINWGSSSFRAYRIDRGGTVVDRLQTPAGIIGLDRAGMAAQMRAVVERWPDVDRRYACGMIGSAAGWLDVGYATCPTGLDAVAAGVRATRIDDVDVVLVPGLACRRSFDGAPDVMRGEETELFGLLATGPDEPFVALPGTHTKWVRLQERAVADFLTCMSGEIYDGLTRRGLLASIVDGEATVGPVFVDAVRLAFGRRLGLGSLLFGARARVVRGELARADAASYLRGLLIGAELADALAAYPGLAGASVPLIGADGPCTMYAAALAAIGHASRRVPSEEAAVRGFRALDAARRSSTR